MSLGNVYAIATQAAGVAGLTDLRTLIVNTDPGGIAPNPTPFTPWSEILPDPDLNGAEIPAGLARCTWEWAFLFKADVDVLLGFTPNNVPTAVFIRTRQYDGSFANFAATMQITRYDPPVLKQCKNVKVEFVALVPQ